MEIFLRNIFNLYFLENGAFNEKNIFYIFYLLLHIEQFTLAELVKFSNTIFSKTKSQMKKFYSSYFTHFEI